MTCICSQAVWQLLGTGPLATAAGTVCPDPSAGSPGGYPSHGVTPRYGPERVCLMTLRLSMVTQLAPIFSSLVSGWSGHLVARTVTGRRIVIDMRERSRWGSR